MRILIHLHGEAVGGYETQLKELVKGLRQKAHQVVFACPPGPVYDWVVSIRCPILTPPSQATNWNKLLATHSPDLVITVQGRICALAIACKKHGIPIFWICGFSPLPLEDFSSLRGLVPLLFDRVLVPSYYLQQRLKREIPESSVEILQVGIDTRHFSPKHGTGMALRQSLGISEKEFVVGYAARFAPHKRHRDLIALLQKARSRGYGWHLLLLGWGQERYWAPFKTLVEQASALGSAVHFVTAVESPTDFYSAMDVFVSPAEDEGLGCSLLEAMACEVPVVLADSGGAPEILKTEQSGIVFETGDVENLWQKILPLSLDRRLSTKLARNGRKVVKTFYSTEHLIESFLSIHRSHCFEAAQRLARARREF